MTDYTNFSTFQTASNATAEPVMPSTGSSTSQVVGNMTFTNHPPSTLNFGTWTSFLPGFELALNDVESYNVDFASPITALGFDWLDVNDPQDTSFTIDFLSGGAGGSNVGTSTFTSGGVENTALFQGFKSTSVFDRVEIREVGNDFQNEFFGQFYTGQGAIVDTQELTISGDGDGDPNKAFGTPFTASISNGIATFKIAGDLNIGAGEVLSGVGANGASLRVANDVNIAADAVIDFSGNGANSGPGGGKGGSGASQGSLGGNGGLPVGTPGAGGPGGTGGVPGFNGAAGTRAPFGGAAGIFGEIGAPDFSQGSDGLNGLNSSGSHGLKGNNDPLDGGVTILGGVGGDGGAGGCNVFTLGVCTGGGAGGSAGTVGASSGNNGGNGFGGDGGDGGATGGSGNTGRNGTPGANTGNTATISGGGGGGGASAGSGGGGGGSGGGGAGGGGGGGGGGYAFILDLHFGGAGGNGGPGGLGATGGLGGQGGDGGDGGGGGGAFEIIANGRINVAGELVARGADGLVGEMGSNGGGGGSGFGGTGGNNGAGGDAKGGSGGKGGTGGRGGDGGVGGKGGQGGTGGSGGGGTVKLVGSVTDGTGSTIDAAGGLFAGDGRFIFGHNITGGFSGSVDDASESGASAPREANPFVNATPQTPFIPGLEGGAEVYGLTGLDADTDLSSVVNAAPANSVAALIYQDVGPTGFDDDYENFDMLLVANLSEDPLTDVMFGAGSAGFETGLLQRGVAENPEFGGDGADPLAELGAGEVYATLVPDSLSDFQLSAMGISGSVVSMSDGNVLFLVAGLLGDYNDNGIVDAADYTAWLDALGGTVLLNDPTPGTVDQSDYDFWKTNFGTTLGSGSSIDASVPEPSTLLLAALLVLGMLTRRGR